MNPGLHYYPPPQPLVPQSVLGHAEGVPGRAVSQSQGLYLHRTIQHKDQGQTSMPYAGFKSAIQRAQGPRAATGSVQQNLRK